jgi:hypothetical protein
MKKEFTSNKELAEALIQELQHTKKEDYFTGYFLDLVQEHFNPTK